MKAPRIPLFVIIAAGIFFSCVPNDGILYSKNIIDINVPESKRKVISVMKFEDRSIKTMDYAPWGMGIPDMIMESLGSIPYYKVISREHLVNAVINEQKFQLLGFTDSESAVKLGNILNAQYVVVGSFSVFNDSLFVRTKVLSVESGQVVVQASVKDTVENFYKCENEIAVRITKGMNLYLSPNAQKKILEIYETKVVEASLENYKGEERLEIAAVLKKNGDNKKAMEFTAKAKKDFKKALSHDGKYKKAKKNLSKLVLGTPMTL